MSGSSFGAEILSAFSRGQMYAAAFRDNMQEYNRSTRTGNYSHSRAEKASVRHIGEAKRWYRQAMFDFMAAENNVVTGDKDKSFNWVCYKCHQASEKALKAAWFAKNANKARQKEHSLTAIAIGLDEGSLFDEAQNLESLTGNYSYLRYPDAVAGCTRIPAELFGSDKATNAIDITKRILDMTSDIIH
ncbi:uncharacterized protein LOC132736304 [Ruditapes philippinarum]|uniref:uncharacterized protein LOC132736304 n=1 Tax=Ruditapes philippinarum TaxID=129788 RepID=UPI00295C3254|nr:uncharacterized protein LOC132736304 [Ruditapes philippinarum]